MAKVPDIILKMTLKELGTGALKTQAESGAGFWVILGDTTARYYRLEDIAHVYPQMTSKRRREIERMVKRADLKTQAVISFHLPDGEIAVDTYVVE
ncbi:MAG: hypothetical protein H0X30_22715 [Anaerolineae bacterium]|nr:hypothetical protein [Anaerolineae bacterium]